MMRVNKMKNLVNGLLYHNIKIHLNTKQASIDKL